MSVKKVTKIITVLLLIATVLGAVNMVFAADGGDVGVPNGNGGGLTSDLTSTTERIIGVVQYICYAAAVILLIYLGIKWLMAAPDTKADMKKSAVVYVVGAALIFAAGAILGVIKNVAVKTVQSSGQ